MSAAVSPEQRHTTAHRCPICDGADSDPRGAGKRCNGFTSPDGEWCRCSREEHAGTLDAADDGLFVHKMHGSCKCGATHGPALDRDNEIEAVYQYRDERGAVLYEVVRKRGKRFSQRKPDGAGGHEYKLSGVRRVLYRLSELLDADNADRTVHVCEGEKDCDALAARGFLATTNAQGAGKWHTVAAHAREVLRDRDVVIVADADDVGRKHARDIETSLRDVARSVEVRECPAPHKDVSDLLGASGALSQLVPLSDEECLEPSGLETRGSASLIAPHAVVDAWKPLADLGDVFRTKPPRRRWLLRHGDSGVLPLGKLGILAAAGGLGKTMAVVQLALAVATGHEWFTFSTVPRDAERPDETGPGRVLLALGEEDEEEVRRRLYHAARAMRLTDAELKLASDRIVALPLSGKHAAVTQAEDANGIVETAAARALRAKLGEANEWRLIVLDPLARFAGADSEKDNAAGTRFIETAESFCKAPGGPTVLVVHHSPQHARGEVAPGTERDASEVSRGVTGITDGARWVAELSPLKPKGAIDARLERLVALRVLKSNYAPKPRETWLRHDRENGGALVALDSMDEKAVREALASPTNGKRSPTTEPNPFLGGAK